MKQYTTNDQTTKLIKWCFEPELKIRVKRVGLSKFKIDHDCNFAIGELLSFLPENVAKENEMPSTLNISLMNGEWCVEYADSLGSDFSFRNVELIDAIFDMLTKLKEKGVI